MSLALAPWAGAALCALALACQDADQERARALQRDVRRAIIETKSLGRYGTFALLQERLGELPCRLPVGPDNPECELRVVGKGLVRLRAAPAEVEAAGNIPAGVPTAAVYPADCTLAPFDRKTFDQVLPRVRSEELLTVWQDALLRVEHRRLEDRRCEVRVEVAPALLDRLRVPAGATP